MKKSFLLLCILWLFTAADSPKRISGFNDNNSDQQRKTESRFDQLLSKNKIDSMMQRLSAKPHHVGSENQRAIAEYLVKQYREWGYEARLDTFYALFPTPKVRLLEAVSEIKFKASLQEPPLKEDAATMQMKGALPPYNCYSADGDVTGELVYVNYGIPSDYDQLERMGIEVKGKIVIARYGGAWRGIKPRLAQERGAIGCLIYSDPKEDGYYHGEVYPKGAYKNEHGVQRGSVLDVTLYPGDPQTPGYGSSKNAKRIDRKEVPNLLKIPVLPISYGDAKPLLAAITGTVAPDNWRGALPITYRVGPGPVKVRLKLEFNWDIVPVYDVIAMLKGSEHPDEWVIRGNHLDAWVNGAADPISGQSALLEEARVIGQLAKEGMRPKRTVVFCAWDGEEPGLIGSTEWVETHAAELKKKAVVYINTDATARGFVGMGGSHTLQKMANEVMADVKDPQTGVSVLQRRLSRDAANASGAKEKKEIISSNEIKLDALGSGSDFTPFFQHIGIPSLNLGFGGEGGGGEYHSSYDTYEMFRRFKDPDLSYQIAIAQTAGRLTLRMANADILPFHFNDFYSTVHGYATDLQKAMDDMRLSADAESRMATGKHYSYAQDSKKKYVPPVVKEEPPYIDFSSLQNALESLKKSSGEFQSLIGSASLSAAKRTELNRLLYQCEQRLMLPAGLPDRPWYKHSIYSPGYYTGYGVKTLPGIREAIENRDWKLAQQQIHATSAALNDYTKSVHEAVELLKGK